MQTAYAINLVIGAEGQLADDSHNDVLSFIGTVDVPMGKVVAKDSSGDFMGKLPTSAGDILEGVALRAQVVQPNTIPGGLNVYPAGGPAISVLHIGRVLVKPEQAMVPGDAVFVRFAAGAGGTVLGSIRKDADSASAVAWPKAKILSTVDSASGLCVLEVIA